MALNLRFVRYDNIVLRRIAANAQAAAGDLAEVGQEAVQWQMLWGYHDVHGNPPHTEIVDTGRLFDSIEAEVNRVTGNYFYQVSIGTDVPYAIYVHEGTSRLAGRPFIADGLNTATPQIEATIRDRLRNGFT